MKRMSMQNLVAVAGLISAAAAPSALAFNIEFERGSYQSGRGGEFVALTSAGFVSNYHPSATQTVLNNANQLVTGFSTFCLEVGESINFTDTYVGSLNQRAIGGGADNHDPVGAGPAGDPISKGTAWLYSQFAQGLLGYNYANNPAGSRKTDAGFLQTAIWYLEDELSLVSPLANPFLALVDTKFGGLTAAQASSNGAYGVSVINVTTGTQRRAQDVLVYTVPDGGMTLALLGGGVLGLALVQRRKLA